MHLAMHPLESQEPQGLCCLETNAQIPNASSGFLPGFLPHLPFLAVSPHPLHAGTDSADSFPSSCSFGRGDWNFLSSVELFLVSNSGYVLWLLRSLGSPLLKELLPLSHSSLRQTMLVLNYGLLRICFNYIAHGFADEDFLFICSWVSKPFSCPEGSSAFITAQLYLAGY